MTARTTAKSYLTAGLALTTATAIAFAPAVIQEAPPKVPALATVTAPAMELAATISPADIQKLIDSLQNAVDTAVTGVSDAVLLPAKGFVQVTSAAQDASFKFWQLLINNTDNVQLKAMLQGLQAVQHVNLGYLVSTATDVESAAEFWVDDMASLVQDTLNEAIYWAVTSIAGVINNPLALDSYTGLLAAATYVGFDTAGNLTWLANDAIQTPLQLLDTAYGGFTNAAGYSIKGWSDFLSATLAGLAGQTGSPVVEGFTNALLSLTTTPLSILAAGFADASYWTPVYTAILPVGQVTYAAATVLSSLLYGASNSIGDAISVIGQAPLDPASYVTSLQGFVTAGFNDGNAVIDAADSLAQIAPWTFTSVVQPTAIILDSLAQAAGQAASGVLAAAGVPQNVAGAPAAFADSISDAIWSVATAATDASDALSEGVDNLADQAIAANTAVGNQINAWLGGLVGSGSAQTAAARSAKPAAVLATAGDTDEPTGSTVETKQPKTAGAHTPVRSRGADSPAKAAASDGAGPKSGVGGSKRARTGSTGSGAESGNSAKRHATKG